MSESPSRSAPTRTAAVTSPKRFPTLSPAPPKLSNWPRSQNARMVLLPGPKSEYIPNLRPTPKLIDPLANDPSSKDSRWRKVVLSRFLLDDGAITFAIGTRFGGTVNCDQTRVPLDKIYDYVTPAELDRFETAEFVNEDEEEAEVDRLAALKKPRGRPKKIVPAGGLGVPSRPKKQKLGPSGELKVQRPRGRPRKYPVPGGPSFNGPQPLTKDHTTDEETPTRDTLSDPSESKTIRARPRVFSMVAAAGLGLEPSDAENTSREITPVPVRDQARSTEAPISKRRRIGSLNGFSGREVSPELVLSSRWIAAAAPVNPGQTNAAVQPRVVIPAKPETRGGETHKHGLEDVTPPSITHTDNDDRGALIAQFQPAGTISRSDSMSSSDSMMSGPTITVDQPQPPRALPGPDFSSIKSTASQKASYTVDRRSTTSTDTSGALSKSSSRLVSLTSHYPTNRRISLPKVSGEENNESHTIISPPRKRKRSFTQEDNDNVAPTSPGIVNAEDEKLQRSHVARTVLDFIGRKSSPTRSFSSRVVVSPTANHRRPNSNDHLPPEAVSDEKFEVRTYLPVTAQNNNSDKGDDDKNQDSHSDASSSSSSILQNITVEPSTTAPVSSQPSHPKLPLPHRHHNRPQPLPTHPPTMNLTGNGQILDRSHRTKPPTPTHRFPLNAAHMSPPVPQPARTNGLPTLVNERREPRQQWFQRRTGQLPAPVSAGTGSGKILLPWKQQARVGDASRQGAALSAATAPAGVDADGEEGSASSSDVSVEVVELSGRRE